jgi:hypothetical protein
MCVAELQSESWLQIPGVDVQKDVDRHVRGIQHVEMPVVPLKRSVNAHLRQK